MATHLEPDEWQQVKNILAPALELPLEEVTRYLDEHCTDPQLRQRVRTFLDAFHADQDFLEEPALAGEQSLEQGARIGPYRLQDRIGEGGMGEVFRAEQEHPVRRTVALKLLRAGWVSSEALGRFQAESQTLALMSHPNIARVFDAGQGPGGRPFLVMEHLEGQPIHAYCDTHRLTLRERLHVFQQVLEGVRHAHRKGVIHRDLKPSNILVTKDDEPRPQIIDFGIAKVHEAETFSGDPSLRTAPGQWLGTPEYMSPEQAGGSRGAVDVRSDVYSLGVVLYELLCGRRPLELPDPRQAGLSALLNAILHQAPPPMAETLGKADEATSIAAHRDLDVAGLRHLLRSDLERIVAKALAKDPADRYESAYEMSEDIRRYLEGFPLLAASPGLWELAIRWGRRHRLAAAVGGLLLLSMTAGILGTTAGLIRAQRAESLAVAQAEKARTESRRAEDAADSSEQVVDFLISILHASDPTQSANTNVTLRQVLDNSAQRVHMELEDRPWVQARLKLAMSYSYKSLGEYQLAKEFGEQALEAFRVDPRDDPEHLVDALFATSEAECELGSYDACQQRLLEALELAESFYGPDHIQLARILNNLGIVYRLTEQLERAREVLTKALHLREQTLDPTDLNIALVLDNLGLVLLNLDEPHQAEDLLERSLHLHQEALGPEHPEVAYSLNNLALVRRKLGDLEAARELLLRAVDIDRKTFGARHPNVATGLYNLGRLAEENIDCPSSLEHYLEAQSILESSFPPDNWKVVEVGEKVEAQRRNCA